jgi:hypothetical protein
MNDPDDLSPIDFGSGIKIISFLNIHLKIKKNEKKERKK